MTVEVEGQPVRVVRLEALAELKRGATGVKDRLVLAILEDTIRRRRSR
jgi:tRNA splicing endonuclease